MLLRLLTLTLLLIISGCAGKDEFAGINERDIIEEDFSQRTEIFSRREQNLLEPLTHSKDRSLNFAYKFLLAYSPLSDLADYSGEFLFTNAALALKSRSETEWGPKVPADLFLNFVLPPRVNNENLDSFRIIYYNELIDRVKGLSSMEAALEINRWCHEKVAYQPSDIRTSSPMSTILSARGRCGEESTLAVAALRTAGIPARQVYTPRWAHCDDNHAWVEVWIDGGWFYMGACEPEPVLDRGWFTEPARRAMLVHTKAFGRYSGNEDVIRTEKRYAEINNLGKYAETKELVVVVTDSAANPVRNIDVEFQLYNYAEFYPIARVRTDDTGSCRFITGLGDLLIWAGRGNKFAYQIISVAQTDTVLLHMNMTPEAMTRVEADLSVPVVRDPVPSPSEELLALNRILNARGDSIRKSYINSWISRDEIEKFVRENKYDEPDAAELILKSQGNYMAIISFLEKNSDRRDLAIEMLRQVSEKDLRDARGEILTSHLLNAAPFEELFTESEKEIYYKYVLNPRIANEMLTEWRECITDSILKTSDPDEIYAKLSEEVRIMEDENYYGTPLTPSGVNSLRVSDRNSFNIFLIAVYRSLGLPARLEPGTMVPQYWQSSEWHDAVKSVGSGPQRATFTFTSGSSGSVPEYYIHFTLARFEGGKYHTLEFDYNKKYSDFPDSVGVIAGHYMLVTGNRVSDSRILSTLRFFTVGPGEHVTIDVTPRKEVLTREVYGQIPSDALFYNENNAGISVAAESAGGIMIAWIDPGLEPSRHLLNDLPRMKKSYEKWSGKIIFMLSGTNETETMTQWREALPANAVIGYDPGHELLKRIRSSVALQGSEMPVVVVADSGMNIFFVSAGYRTGIAEQILMRIE
jgi:hypothetical protein